MPRIFISYRRADSRKDVGRIYDRLVDAFGKENIFKDVDSIPLGKDFREVLREAVAQCDVLLAIIGRHWLDIKDENGNRRLDDPGDFVRIEIESGLQRDSCLVIPVLVDNAILPRADALPTDLRELTFKNATVVRDDPDFHNDVTRIIRELSRISESEPNSKTVSFDVHAAIRDYYRAFDAQEWERARELLAQIRSSQNIPRFFNVDSQEKEVWSAIEAGTRDKEYNLIKLMIERNNKETVWNALQAFWKDFPNYDPDNISHKVQPTSGTARPNINVGDTGPLPNIQEIQPRLIVLRGPQPNQIFFLTKQSVNLGRDLTNDIVFNDENVSRHHGLLRQKEGEKGYEIVDLGSTYGIFVNGTRTYAITSLKDGDIIGLGDTISLQYKE
ncbi:MAG: FHA domain-containing protein [Anaerolineae bacterium]|nr:FHA domain-containing protein [Anaerolineae bacterium]